MMVSYKNPLKRTAAGDTSDAAEKKTDMTVCRVSPPGVVSTAEGSAE